MEVKQEININELKTNALKLLKRNWKIGAILNFLIYLLMAIEICLSFSKRFYSTNKGLVSYLFLIFFQFIITYFYFWRTNTFFKLNEDEPQLKILNIFKCFKKNFLISSAYLLRIIIYVYSLAFLMCIVVLFILFKQGNINEFSQSHIISTLLTYIFAYIFSFFLYVKYSMVIYIIFENPDIKVGEAFKQGKLLIKGYKLKYISIYLSFLGWLLLTLVTFGIAGLWVSSYVSVVNIEFYKKLKEIKHFNIDKNILKNENNYEINKKSGVHKKIKIRELKRNSLKLMKGNWVTATSLNFLTFLLAIVMFFISYLFGRIVLFNNLLSFILRIFFIAFSFFLFFWRKNCFFKLNKDNSELKILNIFQYLKNNFLTFISYIFQYFAYSYLIPFIVVAIFLGILASFEETLYSNELIILFLLIIIFIFFVRTVISYSMTKYVIFDNPNIRVSEAFKKSRLLIKGYRLKYILMYLSLLGWFLLILITLGIAGFWVFSYVSVLNSEFYRKLNEIKSPINNNNL